MKVRKQVMQQCILPVSFMWLELVFHIGIYKKPDYLLLFGLLFALGIGSLCSFLTGFIAGKAGTIVNWVLLSLATLLYIVQIVYYRIFKTYLTFYMLGNAGDATQFWKEGLRGAFRVMPGILLLLVPLVLFGIMQRCHFRHRRIRSVLQVGTITTFLLCFSVCFCLFTTGAGRANDLKTLYFDEWNVDRGVQSFGLMTGFMQDVKLCFTYEEGLDEDVNFVGLPSVTMGVANNTTEPEATKAPECTATPTPIPIDTSPNVFDIDFEKLAAASKDDTIKGINEYLAEASPTNKNAYTGLFEGFNVITLTAESFSAWAVDKELTPTLYKMVHEGFYFKNFYNPVWITSTSDGEYAACMGLLPDMMKNNSFKRSANNSLPICLGHIMGNLGYSTRAYHNNSYTYYGRDKTHPNMGYTYKGLGNGLEVTKSWPESDLEMMQVTIPEYINDEHFHAYYMTVSGHMDYTWSGNAMSKKHKDLVQDLPYSDACKAYIACNIEFDRALQYLIEELEKAGVADKTVIAFVGDHYPYGLTMDEIEELAGGPVDETFELYRSNMVIWSAAMEKPVEVDKYCSSIDMLPTLLNLLGIRYDSRLYSGQDVMSTAPALVQFKDSSFITEYCKYNAKNGKVTMIQDVELPDGYIDTVKQIVKNRFKMSRAILNSNYYKTIESYFKQK